MGRASAALDLDPFLSRPRWLLETVLVPVQGVRFRPTGFPELGPALFSDPSGVDRLIVESQQSMANHLEATIWDDAQDDLRPPLAGLSYVRVIDDNGELLTCSVLEAHRLASPYVLLDGRVRAEIEAEVARPKDVVDVRKLPAVAFALDVGSLVHGVFLQNIAGPLRIPRALGMFIEAIDARPVAHGGVKLDRVDAAGSTKDGYGQVLFHREDFVADQIRAFVHLDVAQILGYRLAPDETRLVVLLALYEVRTLLDRPIRLRTGCDLEEVGPAEVRGPALPPLDQLEDELRRSIAACPRLRVTEVRHAGPRS